ncbi:extracellular solute-binding protein [Nocardiopsis sp. B62]|uniref:extracellular solute-binding protein n=1 Tax=Nocardiopsis sp. B62 TaxID=2824874 RepID=UPI001B3641CE|nr:extracellular solute-binding protein [Nocardiopsis sp. B62]MBQ1080595.1 extracellular solute-binding protein [Nocardiopsis sp. B62]
MAAQAGCGEVDGRTHVRIRLNEYPNRDHTRGILEAARRFEREHPSVVLDITTHEFPSHPEAVRTAVAAGERPAIVQYFYSKAQEARDATRRDGRPLFVPVGRAVRGRTEILGVPLVHDQLIPAARDYYTHEGEFSAMPLLVSTTLLYTNSSLVQKTGVLESPRTWSELRSVCQAVAALPEGPDHGVTWPNHGWIIQQFIARQGALLADQGNGRFGRATTVDLTSEAVLAYVRWCVGMHREGLYLYTGHWGDGPGFASWRENHRAFAEQRTAFALSSSVDAEQMVRAGEENSFSVSLAPLPYNEDRPQAGTMIGGDALWLCADLPRAVEDAALAFLHYLLNAENTAERHRRVRSVPVTREAVELLEKDGWFREHPHERVAVDALSSSSGAPETLGAVIGGFDGVQDALSLAVHDILLHEAEPHERLTRASEDARRAIHEHERARRERAESVGEFR